MLQSFDTPVLQSLSYDHSDYDWSHTVRLPHSLSHLKILRLRATFDSFSNFRDILQRSPELSEIFINMPSVRLRDLVACLAPKTLGHGCADLKPTTDWAPVDETSIFDDEALDDWDKLEECKAEKDNHLASSEDQPPLCPKLEMIRFGGYIYGDGDYDKIREAIDYRFRWDSGTALQKREFVLYNDYWHGLGCYRMPEAPLDEGLTISRQSARQGNSDFLGGHVCRDL